MLKRLSPSQRLVPVFRLTLIFLSIFAATSCHRRKSESVVRTVSDSLRPIPAPPGWRLDSSEAQAAGLNLKFHWEGAAPGPGTAAQAFVCLPSKASVRSLLMAAETGGKPLQIDRSTTQTTTTVRAPVPGRITPQSVTCESAGIIRSWEVFRITVGEEVLSAARPNRGVPAATPNSSRSTPPMDLRLQIGLNWTAGTKSIPRAEPFANAQDPWREIVGKLVLNPADLSRFQIPLASVQDAWSDRRADPRKLASGTRPWARLRVTKAGLIRLTPELLLKSGFPANSASADIRVFSHLKAVPLLQIPSPQARPGWDPGVYFWARPGDSNYDPARVYWITLGSDIPAYSLSDLALTSSSRTIKTIRRTVEFDRDNLLQTRHGSFLAIEEMRWVDARLNAAEPFQVSIHLPGFDNPAARLRAEADFFIDREGIFSDLHVDMIAEGQKLPALAFNGERDTHKVFEIPGAAFQNGRTSLTMTLFDPQNQSVGHTTSSLVSPPNEGGVFFDKLKITYPAPPHLDKGSLRIDPDDIITSETLNGTTAPVMPGAASPGRNHNNFVLQLDDLRSTQPAGLLPLVLNGENDAVALFPISNHQLLYAPDGNRRLELLSPNLADSAEDLEPVSFDQITSQAVPCDLLIIAHRDFLSELQRVKTFHDQQGIRTQIVNVQSLYDQFSHGELSPEAIRSYLGYMLHHWASPPASVLIVGDSNSDYKDVARKGVRNWVPTYTYTNGSEQWASDYWFTTVSGGDDLADFNIGRLSVASLADLKTAVDKIIAYGTAPKAGPWRARMDYIADDGEFPEAVETLRRDETPSAMAAAKVYLNQFPLEDNWYLPQSMVEAKRMKVSRAATEAIFNLFKSGSAFMEYYGHGSPNIWADERIWFGGNSPNSDNIHLAGTGFMPLVANMTCNSGAIDYPLPPWNICITEDMMRVKDGGAIACYVPSGPGVTQIHQQMSEALRWALFGAGARRLGEVITLAKLRYTLERRPLELTYMYLLLGDPALELQLTKQLFSFNIADAAIRPDAEVTINLEKLPLDSGQAICELVDKNGDTLTTAAAKLASGRLSASLRIPERVLTGDARVRLYAWNPQSGDDFAAGANFQIATPALKLDSAELRQNVVHVQISNPVRIKSLGTLEIEATAGAVKKTLKHELLALNPDEVRQLDAQLDSAVPSAPEIITVRLDLSEQPEDMAREKIQTQMLLGRVPPNFLGLIPELCSFELTGSQNSANLRLTATADNASSKSISLSNLFVSLLGPKGDAWSTQPLTLTRRGSVFSAQPMLLVDRSRSSEGKLRLSRRASASAVLNEIPLSGIKRHARDIRIVPGSVHTRPPNPTEGSTVFIDAEIENKGDMVVDTPSISIYEGLPSAGGRPVEPREGSSPYHLPAIAPGRRQTASLRWDPVNNAGRRTLYLQAATGLGEPLNSDADHLTSVTILALSKARLNIARAWSEATPAEQTVHRVRLMCTIANSGQTEARNVMVSFYRSRLQTPETKLGEVEIERIPGGGSQTATFTWRYEPGRDVVAGGQLPQPTMQVWLRGSSQRLSSVGE